MWSQRFGRHLCHPYKETMFQVLTRLRGRLAHHAVHRTPGNWGIEDFSFPANLSVIDGAWTLWVSSHRMAARADALRRQSGPEQAFEETLPAQNVLLVYGLRSGNVSVRSHISACRCWCLQRCKSIVKVCEGASYWNFFKGVRGSFSRCPFLSLTL